MKKLVILLSVLILMVLVFGACSNSNNSVSAPVSSYSSADIKQIGTGDKEFVFEVVDDQGLQENFLVKTDKEFVGEALFELGLIDGTQGAYGLYVKEVNGITLDYEINQKYWAFYINGEYATSGVDKTVVENGCAYSFKAQ
ncbi:MAG: DUF4430 domain-containing protein [Clostridia bacterium]|nr:DUF4430 domain-containing protein [Clostridia bacterium]